MSRGLNEYASRARRRVGAGEVPLSAAGGDRGERLLLELDRRRLLRKLLLQHVVPVAQTQGDEEQRGHRQQPEWRRPPRRPAARQLCSSNDLVARDPRGPGRGCANGGPETRPSKAS